MKILLLADVNFLGGIGTYFKRIVPFLTQYGNVHIVLLPNHSTDDVPVFLSKYDVTWSKDLYRFPRLEYFLMRCFRKVGLFYWYCYFRDSIVINRLVKKYKPDFCFVSQCGAAHFFPILKQRIPSIMICHSLWIDNLSEKKFGNSFRNLLDGKKRMHNKKIIMVSDYAKNVFLKDMAPSFVGHTVVIPNYASSNLKEEIPKSIKREQTINVLTLGTLTEYKNPDIWLSVAKKIQQCTDKKINFIWAGEPLEWETYKQSFAETENVSFGGFCSDVESLYKKADIYFQPSILESQGIAVVDALSYGIPCVVSDAGGLPESITDGKEGFVCSQNDVDGYISAIIALATDSKLYKKMSSAAIKKYKEKFTCKLWQEQMSKLMKCVTE